MPKLSIITINYNNLTGLQKTMQSVFEQTFTDYEYIIIDGGSTDGSKEYIEQYAGKLAYWVSEKDEGVYQAMNKGIVKSKGEYLQFLNSGDYLVTNLILSESSIFLGVPDIVYGDIEFRDLNGKVFTKHYPDSINLKFFLTDSIPHPSCFVKKVMFDKVGLFDEALKICSDYKFFLKAACVYSCTVKHINIVISSFGLDGLSSLNESKQLLEKEKELILSDYEIEIKKIEKSSTRSKKLESRTNFWVRWLLNKNPIN